MWLFTEFDIQFVSPSHHDNLNHLKRFGGTMLPETFQVKIIVITFIHRDLRCVPILKEYGIQITMVN